MSLALFFAQHVSLFNYQAYARCNKHKFPMGIITT